VEEAHDVLIDVHRATCQLVIRGCGGGVAAAAQQLRGIIADNRHVEQFVSLAGGREHLIGYLTANQAAAVRAVQKVSRAHRRLHCHC
jgi:hypothetical protein